jgi:cobalamin biosynthesis protein CobC
VTSPPPLIDLFRTHGGRVDLARRVFPDVANWIDLSTGIAPWSYPLSVADCRVLPSPDALAELEGAAADCFGCAPQTVIAVPGTDLALRLIGSLLPGHMGVVGPGYSGHVTMWNGRSTAVTASAIVEAATRFDALVLARPNNPDGLIVSCDEMMSAARALNERGAMLIVDEAFVDADPQLSITGKRWPATVILRSFGKFYGLAGLRLGFVVAPDPIAAKLRKLLGDWPICAAALATGLTAYRDVLWQAAQRKRLRDMSFRLDAVLATNHLDVTGGTHMFRLIETRRADALFFHLAAAGILTRPFADNALRLRLGLPADDAALDRLSNALKAISNQVELPDG